MKFLVRLDPKLICTDSRDVINQNGVSHRKLIGANFMLKILTISEYLGEIPTQKQVKIMFEKFDRIFPIRTRSI